ncbi:hypothetical protein JST97_29440 [bacterium]|nr:hypothetical protein [bacterium]
MLRLLRMASLHAAQRLRRFGCSIRSVGMIDEPLLLPDDPPILAQIMQQAKRDLKAVWPEAVFSTDLWISGCDPALQLINDVPCSHVFVDRGCGKLGILSGIALARCSRPLDPIAHAMNGQLHGADPGPSRRAAAYALMRNCLLAAGLSSHWWLNLKYVTPAERARLDEPALRWGPFFLEWPLQKASLALLWSPALKGPDYIEQVMATHQALLRAGYACQIVHQDLLSEWECELLLVVGPVPTLPVGFRGKVLRLEQLEALLSQLPRRWQPFQRLDGLSARARSRFCTTWFMDLPCRQAAELVPDLQGKIFTADGFEVVGESRKAGEGRLLCLLNGYEELPNGPEDEPVPVYNHAPWTFHAKIPDSEGLTFLVEGLQMDRISLLHQTPESLQFEPGEMKLLVQAPRLPSGLRLAAHVDSGGIQVEVELLGLQMPWPIELVIRDDGSTLYRLQRATNRQGRFSEHLPMGANFPSARLQLSVSSCLGILSQETFLDWVERPIRIELLEQPVRIWDEAELRNFLSLRPDLYLVGPTSQDLAVRLSQLGFKAGSWAAEEISRRAHYPRLWPRQVTRVRPDRPAAWSPWTIETNRVPRALAGARGVVGPLGWFEPEEALLCEPGCTLRFHRDGRWRVVGGRRSLENVTPDLRKEWSVPWRRLGRFTGHRLQPQTPECWECHHHLVLLGDSSSNVLMGALQASELLPRTAQSDYPGPGRAFISLAWSPFSLGYQAVVVAAGDLQGLEAGRRRLLELT